MYRERCLSNQDFSPKRLARRLVCTLLMGSLALLPGLGQNLVPNPSFELSSSIPNNASQFSLVNNWTNGAPALPTPDNFHALTTSPNVIGLPNNIWGYVPLFDGLAVAGMYTFAPGGYREYIQNQLTTPMYPGQQYLIRFALTLGRYDSSILFLSGTDGFGMLLSPNQVSQAQVNISYLSVIPATPQWELPGYFDDSTWQVFSMFYWPDTTQQYVTFGNFKTNANTVVSSQSASSYMFIDRVEISPLLSLAGPSVACEGDSVRYLASPAGGDYTWWIGGVQVGVGDSLSFVASSSTTVELIAPGTSRTRTLVVRPPLSVDLGPDTTICNGDSLLLSLPAAPNWTFSWPDGSTASSFWASQSGTYVVEADSATCAGIDSIEISFFPVPSVNLGSDTTLCDGEILELTVNGDFQRMWDNGSTDSVRVISQPGLVWIMLENACGFVRDSISLSFQRLPTLSLPGDQQICPGDSFLVNPATQDVLQFAWSDGFPLLSRRLTEPGTYRLQVENSCATIADSIQITLGELPQVSLGPDDILCTGDRITIAATTNVANILWDDGSQLAIRQLTQGGEYWVQVNNECGSASDSILISEIPIPDAYLGNDTILCAGASLQLDVRQEGTMFAWQDGYLLAQREIVESGNYAVRVFNECGEARDEVAVRFDSPIAFDLGPDTLLCEGDVVELLRPDNLPQLLWPDGSSSPTYVVASAERVIATASNACGLVADTVVVEQRLCDCEVYVPTAFSPNDDGVNDRFRLGYTCDFADFELRIYDRWGKLVATFNRPDLDWSGREIPEGVYVWTLRYAWAGRNTEPKEWRSSGSVTLIR